jgi:small subunit ribosomal protein S9
MKVVVASGKRKTAVARATVRKGKGRVRINKYPLEIYSFELARMKMMEPLLLAGELSKKVDIDVNVHGGGVFGQASAVRTAIAKGLVAFFEDTTLEETFKNYDRSLLVSDARRKLPKKPGGRGARKKRQKSYR